MQADRCIILVILGALLALFGIITLQYMLVLAILVLVAIVLILTDVKKWAESLVEKIAAGNRSPDPEVAKLHEAMDSLSEDVERIGKRLDALERQKNE